MISYRVTAIFNTILKLNTTKTSSLYSWRCLSTVTSNVRLSSCHLELETDATKKLQLDYMWLRDHCQCSTCYNSSTFQRNLPLLDIPKNIKPNSYQVDASRLQITWNDGHSSKYDIGWLTKLCSPQSRKQSLHQLFDMRQLWVQNQTLSIPQVQYEELKSGKSGLTTAVGSLLQHGVITITQVPPTVEDTQKVVECIAPVQQTFFGGMWQFGTALLNESGHQDTAYTSDALDPHNDATYFTESVGLQVFHCLRRTQNNLGGETLLVDGMAAANHLAIHQPDAFNILTTVATEAEYRETGHHYVSSLPTIVLDPVTKQVLQIRFNLYDRAPLRTIYEVSEIRTYYSALRKLSKLIMDGGFLTKTLLTPGTVLIVDNWRILHGRTAFTGNRHMTGCYVSRSDWLNKARVLGFLL